MTDKVRSKPKLVYGIGINDADYYVLRTDPDTGRKTVCKFYDTWAGVMERVASKKLHEKYPTYVGCSVVEEWLIFSNFKAWMETQDWEGKHIDKDILFEGNKVYGPTTCVFVTGAVNRFVIDRGRDRGEYPIGVHLRSNDGKFAAQISNPFTSKREHLGIFSNPEDAHLAWALKKLEFAERLAAELTDPRVGEALINRYQKLIPQVSSSSLTSLITLSTDSS